MLAAPDRTKKQTLPDPRGGGTRDRLAARHLPETGRLVLPSTIHLNSGARGDGEEEGGWAWNGGAWS